MSLKLTVQTLFTLCLLLVAPLALAHPGLHTGAGLIDGFMHPASGIDHLLVTIAAGYWAGRGGDHGLRGQFLFMALFATGILLGTTTLVYQLEITSVLIFVLIAVVIAVGVAAPAMLLPVLFASLALYQGATHMTGLPADGALTGYVLGLTLSTGVLLVVGQIVRQVKITWWPQSHST